MHARRLCGFKAKLRADMERVPCKIAKVYQVFPYNLMSDYAGNSKQPFWHMSMIRDPVDRVSPFPSPSWLLVFFVFVVFFFFHDAKSCFFCFRVVS